MKNFTYYVPTKIHFGQGMISHLSELTESGERVLHPMEHELSAYYDITHGVGLPVTNGRKWERVRDLQIPVTAKMVDKLSCRK